MLLNENLIWTDFYHITHTRLSKTISYLIFVYTIKKLWPTATPTPRIHRAAVNLLYIFLLLLKSWWQWHQHHHPQHPPCIVVSECRMATITEKQPHRNPFENKLSDHLGIFHLYNACYWCMEHLFPNRLFDYFSLWLTAGVYGKRKIRGNCKPIMWGRKHRTLLKIIIMNWQHQPHRIHLNIVL